jgi:hypothetical protein
MTATSYSRLAAAIFAFDCSPTIHTRTCRLAAHNRRHDNTPLAELGCVCGCRWARVARIHRDPVLIVERRRSSVGGEGGEGFVDDEALLGELQPVAGPQAVSRGGMLVNAQRVTVPLRKRNRSPEARMVPHR